MESNKLQRLHNILLRAQGIGMNVTELLPKVENAMGYQRSKTIKIVLMGAFSDGKPTAIAAMTGNIESNMKIAIEESSDELSFYHLPALGYDFEIVDTPGLFGSKEKEVDGKSVRYSDVTRDYISQAHIVMYVTQAVNPLKDSHRNILKFVLRDLGKLPNTIFVINKMDEAGYSLIDNEDFENGARIKKASFISKLNEIITLSPIERNNLNVLCLAADPDGKGLAKHFARMDSYLKKSRVDVLRSTLKTVSESLNKECLINNVNQSVITDLTNQSIQNFRKHQKDIDSKIEELNHLEAELRAKYARLRQVTISNRSGLVDDLRLTENEILLAVQNSSMEDLQVVVTKYFGEKGERLSITIENIFSKYAESNNAAFQEAKVDITLNKMSEITKGLIFSMSKVLRNTKIGADAVKGARDIFAAGFKFKPWGAVNLAAKLSKALIVVSLAIDAIMWWKKQAEKRKFEEAKNTLTKCCKEAFSDADQYITPENKYFETFAPGLAAIERVIKDTCENIENAKNVASMIKNFIAEISQWVRNNGTEKVFD